MWDAQALHGREASAARRAGDLDGGHDRGGCGRARRSEVHRKLLGPEVDEVTSQSGPLAVGDRDRGDRGRSHVCATGTRQRDRPLNRGVGRQGRDPGEARV